MPLKRVANASFDRNAKHFTIIKIVSSATASYGFCVSDEGEDAYIPAPLIRKHNLTELDEGAGFLAVTRNSPSDVVNTSDKHTASLTIIPPMRFDDDNPEYVASVKGDADPDLMDELNGEIEDLLTRHETLTGLVERVEEIEGEIDKAITTLAARQAEIITAVTKAFKAASDDLTALKENLNSIHNTLTEEVDWRESNYPLEPTAEPIPAAVIVETLPGKKKLGLKLAN